MNITSLRIRKSILASAVSAIALTFALTGAAIAAQAQKQPAGATARQSAPAPAMAKPAVQPRNDAAACPANAKPGQKLPAHCKPAASPKTIATPTQKAIPEPVKPSAKTKMEQPKAAASPNSQQQPKANEADSKTKQPDNNAAAAKEAADKAAREAAAKAAAAGAAAAPKMTTIPTTPNDAAQAARDAAKAVAGGLAVPKVNTGLGDVINAGAAGAPAVPGAGGADSGRSPWSGSTGRCPCRARRRQRPERECWCRRRGECRTQSIGERGAWGPGPWRRSRWSQCVVRQARPTRCAMPRAPQTERPEQGIRPGALPAIQPARSEMLPAMPRPRTWADQENGRRCGERRDQSD